MAPVLLALALPTVAAGIVLFVLGSLGTGSYRIRRKLPVKSPFTYMHLGSVLFFLGFVLCGVAALIHN